MLGSEFYLVIIFIFHKCTLLIFDSAIYLVKPITGCTLDITCTGTRRSQRSIKVGKEETVVNLANHP